jgi:hypothetical protein
VDYIVATARNRPLKVLNTDDVFSDLLHRSIEFALTAAGDKDVRALRNETFRGGETEPTVASGYNRNLSC